MVPPPRPGDRVVVRHRLPAGSSHPVTDVVGELVADGDELVVRRRDGALVRVARPDVLRLKVVPARAVASSAVREVEHAAALGWPGLEQAWHRGWLLRAGAGLTQRACSAVPLAGPHGDEAPATADPVSLAAVVEFYRARGLVPRVLAVDRLGATPPGWPTGPEVVAVTGPTDAAAHDPAVSVAGAPDAGWLARWGRGADRPAVAEAVVRAAVSTELAFLSLDDGAAIARVGVTTLPGGAVWAGLTGVVVDPARRREGLGTRVSRAAVAWAAERGAPRLCLQVEAGNRAGLALWASLGLTEHHRYRYATPPDAPRL